MPTDNLVEQYLLEKGKVPGKNYKLVNGQYNMWPSPCCGNPKKHHFYINASSGLWDCKVCGAKGNFNSFRKFYGDDEIALPENMGKVDSKPREYKVLEYETARQYQMRLLSLEPEILEYLMKVRGLEEKTIRHFKLGVHGNNIAIPIFDKNEVLTNIRWRRNPKDDHKESDTEDSLPRYWSEQGCKSILFNEACLKFNPKEVYICEGELDAMQLWQRGVKNVVSGTQGAGYFSPSWVDDFKDVKRIYICYDSDDAGIEGAKKVAEKLGEERCRIIELPKEDGEKKMDLTDYFVKGGHTKEEFLELADVSKLPGEGGADAIKHISEFNDELRAHLLSGDTRGLSTGFEKFDAIVGGYRKGRVIVLSGLTSVGKTTFSQNLSLQLAKRQLSVMYISMEMPPLDIYKNFMRVHKRLSGFSLENMKDPSPELATLDEGLFEFKGIPIYLYDGSGELTLKSIMQHARRGKEEFAAQLIVIDHLHYFARSVGNRAADVSNIIRQVKAMAVELDITILLLAHLNRGGREKQRRGLYIPTTADLKESGSIEQDADQVVFVCRDSENVDEVVKKKAVIYVAKNRDGRTGYMSLDFDLDCGVFSEVADGIDYLDESENNVSTSETLDEPELSLFPRAE